MAEFRRWHRVYERRVSAQRLLPGPQRVLTKVRPTALLGARRGRGEELDVAPRAGARHRRQWRTQRGRGCWGGDTHPRRVDVRLYPRAEGRYGARQRYRRTWRRDWSRLSRVRSVLSRWGCLWQLS